MGMRQYVSAAFGHACMHFAESSRGADRKADQIVSVFAFLCVLIPSCGSQNLTLAGVR
jgi:hypothetical protein